MFRKAILALAVAASSVCAWTSSRADPEDKREKIREKMRTIVAARITEELNLDEKTGAKLFPILNKAHDEIWKVAQDSGKARRELRDLVKAGKPDDAKVNKIVDRLLANRAKITKIEDDMYKEVRKILTPTQTAQLVVFLPRLRERMERQIRKAAQGRRGGGADADDAPDDDDF